jgi:hypothetical protein
MRRRNKLKGKKNADRFFMLLALVLVGYVMLASNESGKKNAPVVPEKNPPELMTDEQDASLTEKVLAGFEAKDPNAGTSLDTRMGDGPAVQCGQQVRLRYFSFLLDGTPIENLSTEDKDIELTVGGHENKVIPGIEHYLLGMRKGGERQITLPPEDAYDNAAFRRKEVPLGSPVAVKIHMDGVTDDPALYQMREGFGNILMGNTRRAAWCGEEVTVLVYNLTGRDSREKLPEEDAQRITFTSGTKTVPFWLEQTVVGNGRLPPMNLGAVRTVRLDEGLLEGKDTKHWAPLGALAIDHDKLAFLRVHLVAIGDEKAEDAGIKKKVAEPASIPAEESRGEEQEKSVAPVQPLEPRTQPLGSPESIPAPPPELPANPDAAGSPDEDAPPP